MKKQPVKNLSELRFKMAQLMADVENEEITTAKAKVIVGAGMVIVNALKVEMVNNSTIGVVKEIDFIANPEESVKGEFFKKAKVIQ